MSRAKPEGAEGRQLTEEQKDAELRQERADDDLRAILGNGSGRRFIWSIVYGMCALDQASFVPGGSTESALHREGRRSVGRELMQSCLRVAPSDYVLMVEEAVSRQQEALLKREQTDGRK